MERCRVVIRNPLGAYAYVCIAVCLTLFEAVIVIGVCRSRDFIFIFFVYNTPISMWLLRYVYLR